MILSSQFTCNAWYSSIVRSSFFFFDSPPMNGSDSGDSTVPGCKASTLQPLCDLRASIAAEWISWFTAVLQAR